MNNSDSLEDTRDLWDKEAVHFDDAPDHGLRDPAVRNSWRDLLQPWLPPAPQQILDIGCGTGSLSLLLAELGHAVTGIDLSPAMIRQANDKAQSAGFVIDFRVMDAAQPHLTPQAFDVIVCRHLLWTLPAPAEVLKRWSELLAPRGRLILVEGFWHTQVGLRAQEIVDFMPPALQMQHLQQLGDDARLWGQPMHDERYLIVADRQPQR